MFHSTPDRDPIYIIAIRLILGGVFILAAAESLFNLLPTNIVPESANAYIDQVTGGGVLKYLIISIQLLAGGMIAFNLFVPLGLMILAPVIGNIAIYSFAVESSNIPMALGIILATSCLVYFYRRVFKVFLKMQFWSKPNSEKTCEIIIIDEVEEKFPQKAPSLRTLYKEIG